LLLMLLLVGQERALGTVWLLRPGAEIAVGRKGAPLLIDGDHSVSRNHATLFVGAHGLDATNVKDNGSKFGVHINAHPCVSGTKCPLRVGDKITFGAQGSSFELRACRIAFCMANMRLSLGVSAEQLAVRASEVGVDVVDAVEKCTHLITPSLAVTSKLVAALVFGCHISLPEYLEQIGSLPCVQTVPDPTSEAVDAFVNSLGFLPPPPLPELPTDTPVDLSDVDWMPNSKRRQLFAGKMCLFSTKGQNEKYMSMIGASGGSSTVISCVCGAMETDTYDMDHPKELVNMAVKEINSICSSFSGDSKPELCLILPTSNSSASSSAVELVNQVARVLNVRPISESEIGLAVLFVSSETHTNPALIDNPVAQDGVAEETNNAVAVVTEKPTRRQRKGMRYSNFWSSMVTSDAQPSESDNVKTGGHLHAQESKVDSLSCRKRGFDQFWSTSVKGEETQATIDTTHANQATDGGDSTRRVEDDNVQLSNAPEPATSNLNIVPLIRPRRAADATASTAANISVPNFKRFRKTVHHYQV
ncbi:hypothetical protein H4217_007143, partial [Coemansia sp. RSA 1939]